MWNKNALGAVLNEGEQENLRVVKNCRQVPEGLNVGVFSDLKDMSKLEGFRS